MAHEARSRLHGNSPCLTGWSGSKLPLLTGLGRLNGSSRYSDGV